jgi:periplasmic divalent cation tolerance protein
MGKFQGAAQEKGQGRVYGLSATTRSKFAQCHLLQEESVMESQALAVYCTCPDQVVAERIAEAVVSERLAACVNLVPDVTSIYRWQGEIQRDAELLLIIKTRRTVYPQLEARIIELHPYQVPEIIALPIQAGSAAYLAWIADNTGSVE